MASSLSSSANSSANALLIEMWSDFVCPFCYIGKRKLEVALKDLGFEIQDAGNGNGLPATAASADQAKKIAYIRYRAFELDPNGPKVNPESIATHLSRKYGMPEEAARANLEGMAKEAKKPGVDLSFNYQKLKICNTFDAHRVLHLAQEKASNEKKRIAYDVKERFLKAYFTDGLAIGDEATILKLATECGLDAAEVEKVLGDKKLFADDVRSDEARARQMQVNGVPYFRLNDSVAINGAQSPEQMKATILRALGQK